MYSIDCSGAYANLGLCLEKAGRICGQGGYEIIGGATNNIGQGATAGQYGFFSTPLVYREVIIKRKGEMDAIVRK